MTGIKALGASLALVFFGVWGTTAALSLKFADFPLFMGPALAFTLFLAGFVALAMALYFAVMACDGGEA